MPRCIYAVYDNISQRIIGGLIIEPSAPPAIRAFHDALQHKDSLLAQHPADYNLYFLGHIEDNGTIDPSFPPECVATGNAWLTAQQPQS